MKLGLVKPARTLLALLAMVLALASSALVVEPSCTPADRQTAVEQTKKLAPPIIDAGCVVLELVTDDKTVHTACVYGEDLARLLSIVPTPDRRTEGAQVAFAVPAMRVSRAPPKRHCARWESVLPVDASSDARAAIEAGPD